MSATAVWLWKEWRAQRAFLVGYLALTFSALAIFFAIRQLRGVMLDRDPAMVVLAFVAAAFAGLLLLAAQSVQHEFTGRDDQLLRRLPGALLPAFAGKLAFLLLALAALPLIGFGVGQALLLGSGSRLVGLGELLLAPQALANGGNLLLLGVPACLSIFAVSFWMPRGRLGVGAALLLALALLLAVEGVVRTCSGLGSTLDWRPWLWYLTPLALAVGFAGCVRGRRGGDHRRSAQLGAATLIVGLVPPAGWLTANVHEYQRPDLTQVVSLDAIGTTADGRFVVAHGQREYGWPHVPFCIELATGRATQLAAAGTYLRGDAGRLEFALDAPRRFWHLIESRTSRLCEIRDGALQPLPAPSPEQLRAVADERARTAVLRRPGGLPAWFDVDGLHLQQSDGSVRAFPLRREQGLVAGQGIVWTKGTGKPAGCEFQSGLISELPQKWHHRAFAIDGGWLLGPDPSHPATWQWFDPVDGSVVDCQGLNARHDWVGLLGEGEALLVSAADKELVVYRPGDGSRRNVPLPPHPFVRAGIWYESSTGSARRPYGQRDRQGRMWLRLARRGSPGVLFVAVDPGTCSCTVVAESPLLFDVATFPDGHSVVGVEDHRRLVRIDLDTGARTVLFPAAR